MNTVRTVDVWLELLNTTFGLWYCHISIPLALLQFSDKFQNITGGFMAA